jgi:hypothetical protein
MWLIIIIIMIIMMSHMRLTSARDCQYTFDINLLLTGNGTLVESAPPTRRSWRRRRRRRQQQQQQPLIIAHMFPLGYLAAKNPMPKASQRAQTFTAAVVVVVGNHNDNNDTIGVGAKSAYRISARDAAADGSSHRRRL